jgi:opacity protein-like surface antigen
MSSMSTRLATFTLVLLAAAPAHAEPVVTPYLHVNAGDVELRRGGLGAQVGYRRRWLGVELDVDRHQHFFKDDKLESIPNPCIPGVVGPCIDEDTDAWIFMGNVVGFLPVSNTTKWRPYGAVGVGLIYAWIHDAGPYNGDQTNLALNLGVGVTYWLTDWFGLRADVRYFHAFVDESKREGGYYSDYDFGRFSLGVTFAWPR